MNKDDKNNKGKEGTGGTGGKDKEIKNKGSKGNKGTQGTQGNQGSQSNVAIEYQKPQTEEDFKNTIQNPRNKLIMKKDIEAILNRVIKYNNINYAELVSFFGGRLSQQDVNMMIDNITGFNQGKHPKVRIKNIEPYRRAFVHKSFFKRGPGDTLYELPYVEGSDGTGYKPSISNERIEFLGDSIVGACTAHYLYFKYPKEDEGFLTKIRSRVVRSENLAKFAIWLGFKDFLILAGHAENLTNTGPDRGRNNPRFYEDSFESFIGAIIEDFGLFGGFIISYLFLKGLIEERVNFADLILVNDNYKDILLRHFQAKSLHSADDMKWGQPKYPDMYKSGPPHMRTFTVSTVLDTNIVKTLPKINRQKIEEANKRYLRDMLEDGEEGAAGIEEFKILKKEGKTIIGMGKDKSKKYAGQMASKEALINLGSDEV